MRKQIENYIRSGHAGLYIVSPEEARVEAELGAIAQSLGFGLLAWSVTEGLVDTRDGQNRGATDPLEALNAIAGLPGKTLVLLRDFHPFLEDSPVLIRSLKDQVRQARTANKVLIVLACRLVLPPELEREIVVLNFRLPGKEELGTVLDGICASAGLKRPGNDARNSVSRPQAGGVRKGPEKSGPFSLAIA